MANAPAPKIITPFDYLTLAIPRTWIPMIQGPAAGRYTDNTLVTFQLQQDGYASRAMIMGQILVTVAGTVTSGTIKNHGKWAAANNIQFGPNGSVLLRNHSLWGLYKHNRYRHGLDLSTYGRNNRYSQQALQSMGISQSGGNPQVLTTVTTGAASATQTVGSTAGVLPGMWVYFATAAVYRQVLSITSVTVLVLTATVTTTTGENMTLANGNTAGGYLDPIPGAPIQAGTYILNVMMPMPIAYNQIGQSALLDLNNQSVYQYGIQCGNLISSLSGTGGSTDLFSSLVGSGLTYTATGTFYASYEVFPYLRTDQYNYVEQYKQVMTVLEQTFNINSGQSPIVIPRGDQYSMVLAEFLDSSGNPLTDANMTSLQITYGGSQVMLQQDRYTQELRSYIDHDGLAPMDGVWDVDLGLRTGQLHLRDEFDNFRNGAINNWTFTPTLGSTATGGTAVLTMECLQAA